MAHPDRGGLAARGAVAGRDRGAHGLDPGFGHHRDDAAAEAAACHAGAAVRTDGLLGDGHQVVDGRHGDFEVVGVSQAGNAPGVQQPQRGFGQLIGGVRSKSKAKSLRVLNGKTSYNEWQFTYVPWKPGGQPTTPGPNQPASPGGRPGAPGQPAARTE